MLKKINLVIIIICIFHISYGAENVKIIKIDGNAKVRKGLSETWEKANVNLLLDDMDSILSGDDSEVILQLSDGSSFILRANAMLDIGDLKKVTDNELFFFLMSHKIGDIKIRKEKTPLRIGNVSVIHGSSKTVEDSVKESGNKNNQWIKEKNGALSLYNQKYYSNTIIKLYKILNRYGEVQDCGEIHYYLAKSFEATDKKGMAKDAYQTVVDKYDTQICKDSDANHRLSEAKLAIEKLK